MIGNEGKKASFRNVIAKSFGILTRRPRSLRILAYHSIDDNPNLLLHTPPARFEDHIKFLVESNYKCFALRQVLHEWPKILDQTPAVVITFDDGLLNNFTIACEILAKHSVNATFFVPTRYIGEKRRRPVSKQMSGYKELEMLSWRDLRAMHDNGFEVGAHSHTHVNLAKQTREMAICEIRESKGMLEHHLGTEVTSFAYPYGHTNSFCTWTRLLLAQAGYKLGCTMVEAPITRKVDFLQLPRIGITGFDTIETFKLKLEGYYDCLKWFRPIK